jgi:hypothetical protein
MNKIYKNIDEMINFIYRIKIIYTTKKRIVIKTIIYAYLKLLNVVK